MQERESTEKVCILVLVTVTFKWFGCGSLDLRG